MTAPPRSAVVFQQECLTVTRSGVNGVKFLPAEETKEGFKKYKNRERLLFLRSDYVLYRSLR